MISKRVYLLLTAGLLVLSIGASFAGQSQTSHRLAAMDALKTASLQLSKVESKTAQQVQAEKLIDQAIETLKTETLKADQGTPAPVQSSPG